MSNTIFLEIHTKKILAGVVVGLLFFHFTCAQKSPKREFRGVWIASVANIDWPSHPELSTEAQRDEFRSMLNYHHRNGINAVIVQVRPSADAFYRSQMEPWSEWLTGTQGKNPDPEYDPLTFMVEEAHERGMEFHAWLNPYRAVFDAKKFYQDSSHIHLDTLKSLIRELVNSDSTNTTGQLTNKERNDLLQLLDLDTTLLIYRHPHWFLQYGNKIYFDPGIPEVQRHIINVVEDIVTRYDVDAIHMDDYFYPYKISDQEFPDSLSFAAYGKNYTEDQKDFWRRDNVNAIVKMLHETIKMAKPYVKFGISPFGVWRNASVDPAGSATKAGQTNYDDLYADVLKWQKEKWIDYVIPQVYWNRGFELADYEVLAKWWNENHYGIQVYIGQGLYRVDETSKTEAWRNPMEIPDQIDLNRSLPNIRGSCFFSSKSVINNPLGVSDILRNHYYQYPALVPEMEWLNNSLPQPPEISEIKNTPYGIRIEWEHTNADYFIIYRFRGKRIGDIDNPSNILAIQRKTMLFIEDRQVKRFRKYTYAISALDRLFNETPMSKPMTMKWKKLKKL